MSGGIEGIYDKVSGMGMSRFAPVRPARGARFSSRQRGGRDEKPAPIPVVPEGEYDPESG